MTGHQDCLQPLASSHRHLVEEPPDPQVGSQPTPTALPEWRLEQQRIRNLREMTGPVILGDDHVAQRSGSPPLAVGAASVTQRGTQDIERQRRVTDRLRRRTRELRVEALENRTLFRTLLLLLGRLETRVLKLTTELEVLHRNSQRPLRGERRPTQALGQSRWDSLAESGHGLTLDRATGHFSVVRSDPGGLTLRRMRPEPSPGPRWGTCERRLRRD